MKFKSLLVMMLSMLMTSAAFAQWTKPAAPVGVDPVSGGQYYIMNVEAGQFLTGAKVWFSWATSAGLADAGQLNTLTETEGKWTIQREDGKYTFISGPKDGRGEMHVDGANPNQWNFTKVGDAYRISVDASDDYGEAYAGTCWGWEGFNGAVANAIVANLNPENAFCEWVFMDAEALAAFDGATYRTAIKAYYTAQTLKADIDAAKADYPSIDVAAEQAVYDNTASTLKQLEDAIQSIKDKVAIIIADQAAATATYDNPIDLTKMIVNPTFDGIKFDGWGGSGFGAGGTTSDCAERYQMVFDTYQDIKNVPNGVFAISVDGMYRAGSSADDYAAVKAGTPSLTKLYGVNLIAEEASRDTTATSIPHQMDIVAGEHFDDEGVTLGGQKNTCDGVDYWVPNSMKDFTNYNGTTAKVSEPFYKGTSVLVPVTERTIRIGVKNATSTGWSIFDNFGLVYYGNGADAWTALIKDYSKNIALPENIVATKALVEDYNTTVAALTAESYETYKTAVASVVDKKAAVDENAAAWAAYIAEGEKAQLLIQDPKYADIAVDLADYLKNDFEFEVEDLVLTTEEVIAETKTLTDLYEEAKALTPAGTDVSGMLTNPDFSKGWDGWSHSGTGGNVAANSGAKCAEAWNSANFDIHQDIENAPIGVYEIQVQGFYRYGRGHNAWLAYFNEDGTKQTDPVEFIKETPAYIYANDNKAPMANVFDYQVAVEDNYYTGDFYKDPLEAYVYPNNMADAGAAFDRGAYKSSAFGLVAKKGDPLRVGMKGNSNQLGDSWAIFTRFKLIYQGFETSVIKPELEKSLELNLTEPMAAATKAAAEAAVAAGKEAVTGEDGRAMFDALSAIYSAKVDVEESVKVYAELAEKNNALSESLESESPYVSDATVLWMEVSGNLESGAYTDEEATAKTAEIVEMLAKLAIPDVTGASEENPIDMTTCIVNPSFEINGIEGWTNSGKEAFGKQTNTSFGKTGDTYAERWHADGTLDINQTIKFLPAGKYVLSVDAHCSTGDGVLYANAAETPITNVDDAANPSTDQVTVILAEGEALKIGVKATLTATTWCCVDNFQLAYLGTSEDGIAGITTENVAKAAIYTLNGTQVKKFQKGINIVRMNGKVVKFIVK